MAERLAAGRSARVRSVLARFPCVYPILDTGHCSSTGWDVEDLARVLADEGRFRIAQFRHKGDFTRKVFAQAQAVCTILRRAGVCFVLNDRADIAMAVGADGVHVGQEDLPPSVVRSIIGRDLLLGYSTHSAAQLADAECETADYLAIGPVYGTTSKLNPDPTVGEQGVGEARRLTGKPLVAIGGISLGTAPNVLRAGADGISVISGIGPSNVTEWAALQTLERLRRPADAAKAGSKMGILRSF